jgi:glycosyltransferase involved in cell wall biosynthesis
MGTIRVAALMEAATVTGPANNLIRFCQRARISDAGGRRAEVSILTFVRGAADPGRVTNQFIAAARDCGIRVEVIPERFRFDSGIFRSLRSTLDRLAPDIVQSHGVKSHFAMRRRQRALPWIAFHHGYTAENLKVRLYNRLDRWSLPAADRVITVCKPFAEDLARAGVRRERIEVLPNTIEPGPPASQAEVEAIRQRLGIQAQERVVLAVGRLSPEKGHRDLLSAMRRMITEEPLLMLRLVIVGDGVERRRLEGEVSAAGLSRQVIFAGHQADVRPYYGLANVFVLPSHSEGSPNVLLEAMAAGLPIAATAVGGVPETVQDGRTALLAEPRDPAALANVMLRLLRDGALAGKLARSAEAVVAERFSAEAYRRALLDIYGSVACSRRPDQRSSVAPHE